MLGFNACILLRFSKKWLAIARNFIIIIEQHIELLHLIKQYYDIFYRSLLLIWCYSLTFVFIFCVSY